MVFFKPGARRFEPLARYKAGDTPVCAHLAVLGNRIPIKDKASLALWRM